MEAEMPLKPYWPNATAEDWQAWEATETARAADVVKPKPRTRKR